MTPKTPLAPKRAVEQYERLVCLDLTSTLFLLQALFETKHRRTTLQGHEVNVSSMRLKTFAYKGPVCVGCGKVATHFALERTAGGNTSTRPHLNLWGVDEAGDEVLFTQDHIQPRAKGGKDVLENSQTMCSPCNGAKKDTWEPLAPA